MENRKKALDQRILEVLLQQHRNDREFTLEFVSFDESESAAKYLLSKGFRVEHDPFKARLRVTRNK